MHQVDMHQIDLYVDILYIPNAFLAHRSDIGTTNGPNQTLNPGFYAFLARQRNAQFSAAAGTAGLGS